MRRVFTLTGALFAISIAACGRGAVTPVVRGLPSGLVPAASSNEKIVYEFKNDGKDGQYPTANLIPYNGALYGTTYYGGPNGQGTVFKIALPSGSESVIYRFKGGSDGSAPNSGLVAYKGELYGTTIYGGTGTACNGGGCGTVFAVTPSGKERIVYRFPTSTGAPSSPWAGLLLYKGAFYGTTAGGGHGGTVFKLTPSGAFRIIYGFNGPPGDAYTPNAAVIVSGGYLYGTTANGGVCYTNTSCGAVYRVSFAGKEQVLHFFSGPDGRSPVSNLVLFNGQFYGTTQEGGLPGDCQVGCGVVYAVTAAGKERTVYRFKGVSDGDSPRDGLIAVNGALYGTTVWGGAPGCKTGCGTIFRVTASGKETKLHSFLQNDATSPTGSLVNVNGTLYGTSTQFNNGCCGAIFSYKL